MALRALAGLDVPDLERLVVAPAQHPFLNPGDGAAVDVARVSVRKLQCSFFFSFLSHGHPFPNPGDGAAVDVARVSVRKL